MSDVKKFEELKERKAKINEIRIKLGVEIKQTEEAIGQLKKSLQMSDEELQKYENKTDEEIRKLEEEISNVYNEVKSF